MEGGNTKPRLVTAIDEHDQTKQVVLKPRIPTASAGDGHYAGTSLACELICAVLARAIGLNVPDYAIVDISPTFANSIHDSATRELFRNNIGPNFGSVFQKSFALWQPKAHTQSQELIDQLEDVLTFDSIVINGDRKMSKPNLLYRGDQLLLIDHSLALPVHLWKQQTLASSPLYPVEHIKTHCASQHLIRQACSYSRVFENWEERIAILELEKLRTLLPDAWQHKPGDFDKIFAFLSGRNQRFAEMSNYLMEVLS